MEKPYCFHIGTQRAGSTFLFHMLSQHPDISLSPMQEINFFARRFEKGTSWYLKQFPKKGVMIDTTPQYFILGDVVAPRIKKFVGKKKPKIILVLRNLLIV